MNNKDTMNIWKTHRQRERERFMREKDELVLDRACRMFVVSALRLLIGDALLRL